MRRKKEISVNNGGSRANSEPAAGYQHALGEPDSFRLRYRTLITELVATVVRAGMDKKAATVSVGNVRRSRCHPRIRRDLWRSWRPS